MASMSWRDMFQKLFLPDSAVWLWLIDPEDTVEEDAGKVRCRERLGGILRYYYRSAA